ncbi:MAG: hypothetical protein AB1444_16390, partial [Spirochaetota bacterium]
YWYMQQDGSRKLPGLGGVFNAVNMDVYHYAGNNPVKLVDPDGQYAIYDDLAFAVGGAIIGLGSQAVQDMLTGTKSDWEDYAAAGIGGAIGGWALLYTGPVGAGAAGGAITNSVRQGLKWFTGKQKGFDISELAIETGTGALLGKLPGIKVKGVTSGRGSMNAVYKQMTTKLREGTIKSIKPKTAIKMFKGRIKDTAFVEGAWANSMINAGKNKAKDEK